MRLIVHVLSFVVIVPETGHVAEHDHCIPFPGTRHNLVHHVVKMVITGTRFFVTKTLDYLRTLPHFRLPD